MDRYQKVQTQRSDAAPINENEIRITTKGVFRNYITYANTRLNERKGKEIVIKAMGMAISKAVAIAEIVKRKLPHLHQDTVISSVSITDVWEPIEEGLLRVEQTRHVSMISISLSANVLDKNSPGYQAPTLVEQPSPQHNNYQQKQPLTQGLVTYHAVNEDSYGRGQSRGGVRGRGWSRGGYVNYQENGGYSNSNHGGGGGRGRSWGNRGYGHEGGNRYDRGNGNGYNRGDGYYRRGGDERGNGYERSDGYERDNGNRRGGAGNDRGPRNYERGAENYERGGGYEQRGRGSGGQRGGYGRGAGRMGVRGRNGDY